MHWKRSGALATAAVASLLVPASIAMAATAVQTLSGEFKPKKLPKKEYVNGSLRVHVTAADADDPDAVPPAATHGTLYFDDDGRVNTKAVPTCAQAEIENTTTETALSACGEAKVGSGSGVAALPFGVSGSRTDFPAVVTAFNSDSNGVLLHARVDELGTSVVIPSDFKKGSGDFGIVLDVAIPSIAGGVGSISDFEVTVKRGKYVQARCHDKNRTLNADSTFSYVDAPDTSASFSQKCKVKRPKK